MASSTSDGGGGAANAVPRKGANRVAPRPGEVKENRDPNNLNGHLTTDFYSVFGEPGPKPMSLDCTWEFSELCYDLCYGCLYNILATLCGCWIAIYWGCQMVPYIFTHVWILTPCNTAVKMVCGVWCKTFWLILARCCVAPCAKACAPFFRFCGDGLNNPPKTPPIFPSGKRSIKPVVAPVVQRDEPETDVLVPVEPNDRHFDDYDKTKIANSVRRQMMLV